jgi:phospholipase/carboxylesterase
MNLNSTDPGTDMTIGNSSLKYTVQQPTARLHGKAPVLVLLHGRGADENDLMGLAQYFDERLLIISVRAPYSWMQGSGYTWFDIEDIGSPNPKMFAESYGKLLRFLHDLHNLFSVDDTKITLCGFSMGAMMSYSIALAEPELVNGIMALSGLIPKSILKTEYNLKMIKGKPFFISHGLYDSVIPVSFGRSAKKYLTDAGANVVYREYDMDHQIGEETLNDMINWMHDLIEDKEQ